MARKPAPAARAARRPRGAGPAAPLGPAHPGAGAHAGGLRGARGLQAPARLPPRPRAPRARALGAGRAPRVRPAQHPLHLRHRHRRVGARQADPLLAPERRRASPGSGTSARRRGTIASTRRGSGPTTASPAWSACAARCRPSAGLFEQAAREIKAHPQARGRGEHAARHRHGRAAISLRAPEGRHRGARLPAGHAGGARDQERRRAGAAQHGGGHGRRRLPGHLRGAQAGRARERDRGARDQAALRDGLGLRRGDQRHLGRALLAAPAQLHRPHAPAGRPGLLRHHPVLRRLPDVLLPDVQRGPRDRRPARAPTRRRASGWTAPSR